MDTRVVGAPQQLYESFLEVAAPQDNEPATVVKTFPEECEKDTLKQAPLFCYACQPEKGAVQHFTFVLTDGDGKYRFGFCRYPPDASLCLCFISYLPWFEFFYAVLDKVAELRMDGQGELVLPLLKSLMHASMPIAGERFMIVPEGLESGQAFSFQTPDPLKLPSIPESINLTEYITNIDPVYILHLFAAMLFERRIIITSSKLSLVSACVHGAASLLYPLNWQHIFIPIMPAQLVEYCCAPMPFLIGVHSSVMAKIRKMPLDEVVVLDADANQLEIYHNDLGIIPSDVTGPLKDTLKKHTSALDDTVAKAFLDAFVFMIGGYRDALRFREGEQIKFDAMVFIESRPKQMQPFLQKVLHLQQFQQFMMERLHRLNQGQGLRDVFENAITSSSQDSTNYLNKYALWVRSKTKKGFSEISSITSAQVLPSMKTAFSHIQSRTKKGVKGLKQFMNDDKPSQPVSAMSISSPQLESKTSFSVSELISALPAESSIRKQAVSSDTHVPHRQKRPPPVVRPYSEYRATKSSSGSDLGPGGCDIMVNHSAPLASPLTDEEIGEDRLCSIEPSLLGTPTEDGDCPVVDDLLGLSVANIPSRSHVTCLAREMFLNFENVTVDDPEQPRDELSSQGEASGAIIGGSTSPTIGEALSPTSTFDPFASHLSPSSSASFHSEPPQTLAGLATSSSSRHRSSVDTDDCLDDFSALARERSQPSGSSVTSSNDPWMAHVKAGQHFANGQPPSALYMQCGASPSVAQSRVAAEGDSLVHPPNVSCAPQFNAVRASPQTGRPSSESTGKRDPLRPTPFDDLLESSISHLPSQNSIPASAGHMETNPFSSGQSPQRRSSAAATPVKPGPPVKPYRRSTHGGSPTIPEMAGQPGLEFDPLA